jgi:hypothetical protein
VTFQNEAAFADYVETVLRERYEQVEREPTLPSGREPDFIVSTLLFTLVVEVEHDPADVTGDVIRGAAQALDYAGEVGLDRRDPGTVPAVICNAKALDVDQPEVVGLRTRLPVISLSTDVPDIPDAS